MVTRKNPPPDWVRHYVACPIWSAMLVPLHQFLHWHVVDVTATVTELGSHDGASIPINLPPAMLRCDTAIDTASNPPAGYTVIRGIAALRSSRNTPNAQQTRTEPNAPYGARLFAKSALLVRRNATVKLIVPDGQRHIMSSIQWGNGHDARTWELTVPVCGETSEWNVFVGGYWVENAGCMKVIVRDGDHDEIIEVGIGVPCGDQKPAPAPSDR